MISITIHTHLIHYSEKIDELIHSQASSLACKQPRLPVFSSEIMKFIHEEPPIVCSSAGKDWVKCEVNDNE